MSARTLRRVRAGLSESDAYWLRELHAAPAAVQVNVARLMAVVGEAAWRVGIDIDNPQHADARTALMGTLHRFYATNEIHPGKAPTRFEGNGAALRGAPDATDRGPTPSIREGAR